MILYSQLKVNNNFFLLSNPFIDAYVESDFLGKAIFIGLLLLSVFSWCIMIHKCILTYQARKHSNQFYNAFQTFRANPLAFNPEQHRKPNPFLDLYSILKKHTTDILNKNRRFASTSYLYPSDIDFIDTHLATSIASQTKQLDRNLFILSTIVSLGPFLGLLGTVWGILTTFSEMQLQTTGSNQAVLGGISLALATTVLGLLDAIPALIGYNYLKNNIGAFQTEMECFATEMLSSVEMQYRKVEAS